MFEIFTAIATPFLEIFFGSLFVMFLILVFKKMAEAFFGIPSKSLFSKIGVTTGMGAGGFVKTPAGIPIPTSPLEKMTQNYNAFTSGNVDNIAGLIAQGVKAMRQGEQNFVLPNSTNEFKVATINIANDLNIVFNGRGDSFLADMIGGATKNKKPNWNWEKLGRETGISGNNQNDWAAFGGFGGGEE